MKTTAPTSLTHLIQERLNVALAPTHLELIDNTEQHVKHHRETLHTADHFTVTIVSSKFVGLTLVQRHRLVYNALEDLMNQAIHALSIQAQTPEEFNSDLTTFRT